MKRQSPCRLLVHIGQTHPIMAWAAKPIQTHREPGTQGQLRKPSYTQSKSVPSARSTWWKQSPRRWPARSRRTHPLSHRLLSQSTHMGSCIQVRNRTMISSLASEANPYTAASKAMNEQRWQQSVHLVCSRDLGRVPHSMPSSALSRRVPHLRPGLASCAKLVSASARCVAAPTPWTPRLPNHGLCGS